MVQLKDINKQARVTDGSAVKEFKNWLLKDAPLSLSSIGSPQPKSPEQRIRIFSELVDWEPKYLEWPNALAKEYAALARNYAKTKDVTEAQAAYEKAIDITHKRMATSTEFPEDRDYQIALLRSELAGILTSSGDYAGALTNYDQSQQLLRPIAAKFRYLNVTSRFVLALEGKAEMQELLTDREGAITTSNEARVAADELVEAAKDYPPDHPAILQSLRQQRTILRLLGRLRTDAGAGERADALIYLRQQYETEKLIAANIQENAAQKSTEDLAWAYNNLAWGALIAGANEDALESATRAVSMAPNRLVIAANKAHALMFLGRVDEARAEYLSRKGQKDPDYQREKTWNQAIIEDFKELRKYGVTNPLMEEIRTALAEPAVVK
jgi:tetratricopeptide (TPR) repeat protein